MKILNLYYNFIGNSDVIKYLSSREINISWVVEAGCHDGEDTLKISRSLNPSRIIAFEPDEHARIRASQAYAPIILLLNSMTSVSLTRIRSCS